MAVPLDVRKQLWSWHYGRQAFQHCKDCCDHMLNHKLANTDPLFHPLNVAAVVCYGRPFKTSHGLMRLPDNIIPIKYSGAHREILSVRDKFYAHVDAEQSSIPSIPLPAEVVFSSSNGKRHLMVLDQNMQIETIRDLSHLAGILIEKCYYHINKICHAHKREFPIRDGTYRIGILPDEPAFNEVSRDWIPVSR